MVIICCRVHSRVLTVIMTYLNMPRLSLDARRKVIMLHNSGLPVRKIKSRLSEEKVYITRRSLYRLIKRFQQTNHRKRDKKMTQEMAVVMNSELEQNDEATARQLRSTLMEKYPTLDVSLSTMKRQRKQLGWVCTRPHYCQLI